MKVKWKHCTKFLKFERSLCVKKKHNKYFLRKNLFKYINILMYCSNLVKRKIWKTSIFIINFSFSVNWKIHKSKKFLTL